MNRTSKRVGKPRPRAFAAMIGLVAFVLAVSSWSPVSATSVSGLISLSSVRWIFYKEDFNHLKVEAPALIRQILAGPGTYVLEHRVGGPPLPPKVIPAEMFFSSAELQAAIQHHRVIPGVKFVVDDLEDLGITPRAERKEPIPAMKGFAHAAHARGYQPVLIPGRDLMLVSGAMCSQQRGHTISQSYLSCHLPAAAAAYAPIYVIQAAAVETNLTALRQLVQEAAAQARKANPNVTIFATLSVSPNGAYAPAIAVVRAAEAIRPYVQGFEMNNIRPSDSRMIGFLTELGRV
jgi:hypothetical protein